MATSKLSICNKALFRISASRIAVMDEGSREADACTEFFDSCVEAALSDHEWNFASRRRKLADTGDTVAPWAYGYAYPGDCLVARLIYNPSSKTEKIDYEVAINNKDQAVIYTDRENAELIYTARVNDFSLCSALFIEAVTWKLAAELVIPLSGNETRMQIALTMYKNALSDAKAQDANEGKSEPVQGAKWIQARLGVSPYINLVNE